MAMTWGAFLKDIGEEFSTAYSKADERRAEKEEERKKLRAKVAKLENAIRSASGEEVELATGIKPRTEVQSEGMLFPEESSVQVTPADQIFKKLKNKNLMERLAALEAVADRLPEARTELRGMRRDERIDKKWQRDKADAKSEKLLDEGVKAHEKFLDKQAADKKAAEEEEKRLKAEAEVRLTRDVETYERLKEGWKKDQVLSDRYQGIIANAVGDPDLQQEWMNPDYEKAFLAKADAPERLDVLSEYIENMGKVPEVSRGLSTGFVAEAKAAKVAGKAEQMESDAAKVSNAAYLKIAGVPDWAKGLSSIQKGKAERKAIGIHSKVKAEISIAEKAAKTESTKDYNYYRNQSVNQSSESTEDGLPLWVIFEDVDTKGNPVARAKVAPDILLSVDDRDKLRSSLKARQRLLDLDLGGEGRGGGSSFSDPLLKNKSWKRVE